MKLLRALLIVVASLSLIWPVHAQAVITASIRFSQGGSGVGTAESISFYVDVVNASTGQPAVNAQVTAKLTNSSGTTVWSQSGTTGTDGSKYFVISPTDRQNTTGQVTLTATVQAASGGGQATASQTISIASSPTATSSSTSTNPLTILKRNAEEPIRFTPEVVIPNFGGNGEITVTGQTIAQYIRAVFIYFIWGVGILATVMIVYGGVRWVAAAGNAARINDARETVNNAIIGLIIALTSVLLLNIINPDLTRFKGLTPVVVTQEVLQLDNLPGDNNEGATCTSKGRPVQQESTCAITNANFVWPVTASHAITSRIGPRNVSGAATASTCHPGTDFSTDQTTGKPLIAVFSGTIDSITSACNESVIKLKSSQGYYVKYIHVHTTTVKAGDAIDQGKVIGYSGGDPSVAGSCSNGPHLHLEFYDATGALRDIAPCVAQAQ